MKKNKKSQTKTTVTFVLIGAFVVATGCVATYLYMHHATKPTVAVHTTSKQYNVSPSSTKTQGTGGAQNEKDNNTSTTPVATATLLTPSGTFVSNHHPNLSASPAPNVINSVCVTTPGAQCVLSFTSGTTTKMLSQKTTDANGAAYWNWKLQDIGITQGNWTITATATLSSQTKTTTDPLTLQVSP